MIYKTIHKQVKIEQGEPRKKKPGDKLFTLLNTIEIIIRYNIPYVQ